MLIRPLPPSFNFDNGILPPVYGDHFLFAENLHRPYECDEHTSGIGLLMTGKGKCNYYVNSAKNQVDANKVFFINRGSTLAVRATESESAPVLLFFNSRLPDLVQYSLEFGDEVMLEKPFDNLPYDFSYLERIHADDNLHQTILSLIDLGASCSSFASLTADMTIRNLFEALLLKNQDAYKRSQNIQAVKASTRLEIFKRVASAKDWMEQNYQTDITLEDISSIAAMNSQHFLRMFKQVYMITPHQFLIDLKLKKAKELLETTPMPINDVCQTIGFESVFSFSVLFKNRFGTAPSYYRKGE
ncbi:helix-turn-helix transcriptional regulator [Mucilaginibacter gotjawali]|uniref:Transcriptional activator NphR n=2 Tax=Mucilaginibacter gotjawali TaxID=1550579 RepID=A0A110B390_9SPHI|nr:AraC family transcriptional regulator [Mucilaginibacter gotjawali]MBB3055821.1 AraC-like DNA-binding protein [Mucilaginibacter gotjawali]BAU54642.1 Transcriptional activator NphR [Mucilaginibacter gotjawali]